MYSIKKYKTELLKATIKKALLKESIIVKLSQYNSDNSDNSKPFHRVQSAVQKEQAYISHAAEG